VLSEENTQFASGERRDPKPPTTANYDNQE
jgi:hypothetical protein